MGVSIAKSTASGTTDLQAVSGPGTLAGVLVTQITAASAFALYDGTSTAGNLIFSVSAPVGSTSYLLPNVRFGVGVFVDRDATNAQAFTLYLGQGF